MCCVGAWSDFMTRSNKAKVEQLQFDDARTLMNAVSA
jgi:hypothetical protein